VLTGSLTSLVLATTLAAAQPASNHPVAFWRSVADHEYAPPPGSDVAALTLELEGMLASPDPERRDEIAFSTLTAWIYQKRIVEPATLRTLVDRCLTNMTRGIGESGTDSVFRRSFSALTLSVVIARDNAAPFLAANDVRRIENAAIDYLAAERDVRGYDAEKGWVHTAAHTADLLKFVARSRELPPAEQPRILDAISGKLGRAEVVFTHGEDERLARAILSIVNRPDFDRAQFEAWTVRAKPVPVADQRPKPAQLRAVQNAKNLFAKLETLLAVEGRSDSVEWALERVRTALKGAY
jgi:Protein of unknown function (DUF2785)